MVFSKDANTDSPFAVKPKEKGKRLFFLALSVFVVSLAAAGAAGWDVYQKNKKPFSAFTITSPFLRSEKALINPQPMFRQDDGPASPTLADSFKGQSKTAEEKLAGPKNIDEALKSAMLNFPPQQEIDDKASIKENPDLPMADAPESGDPAPEKERVIDIGDEFGLRRPPLPRPDLVSSEGFTASLPKFNKIKDAHHSGVIALDIINPVEELQEESRYGKIPVKSENGETPYQTYARPYEETPPSPFIAVLISGLGMRKNTTTAALYALKPEVSLSFSPYSEQLGNYVSEARKSGHETLLDLPMQQGVFPETDPGPLGLVSGLPEKENRKRLHRTLGKDVAYIGVSASPEETFSFKTNQMGAFAKEIRDRGLIYIDGTDDADLPLYSGALRPDVHITDHFYRSAIRTQLEYAEKTAKKKGYAFVRAETAPIVLLCIQEWMDSFVPKDKDGERVPEITFVPLSYYATEVLKTRK